MKETKPLSEFSPDIQAEALRLFADLANAQRGVPESMATIVSANPTLWNATGAFTWMAEHVGDLTHRMSQRYCEEMSYGWENVDEKTRKALRYFDNGYGFEREVQDNLQNNYEYRKDTRSFDEFVADFRKGAERYAVAHSQLRVWNRMQHCAKMAAVSLGFLKYHDTEKFLRILREKVTLGREGWSIEASMITVQDGKIIPFLDGLRESDMRYWIGLTKLL